MDIKIICCDCGKEFVFSSREQEFYARKGFSNPKRCKKCRENNFANIGLKRSSYYDNAQTFGVGTNVRGGLYIEYIYYIKSPTKGFLMKDNGKLCFNKNITEKSLYSLDKEKTEELCNSLNKKYNLDCQIYCNSKYIHRNGDV